MAESESASHREIEFDAIRNAKLYDLTQSYVVDKSDFVARVAGELSRRSVPPRVVELGCGTGSFALPLLKQVDTCQYLGLDVAPAMVDIFRSKLSGMDESIRAGVELEGGVDLRRREAYARVRAFAPDAIICSQFTQYLSMASGETGEEISRLQFLQLCREVLGDEGVMYVVDDVDGETDEQSAQLGEAWDRYVIERYRGAPDLLARIGQLDEQFVKVIQAAMGNPSLMAMIRRRRRKNRGELIIPASVERKLFTEANFTIDEQRHGQLLNFYLYILRPADGVTR